MSELLDRVVIETRKMKEINLRHPISIKSHTEKHKSRFEETREQVEAYRSILELILRVTRCDCVVLTTIEGEYPDCGLLGGFSDLSPSAKRRLANNTRMLAPSKFDSPVEDPVNFLGHVFFETGMNDRMTPFERSLRDKGYFSIYVPEFATITNVVCCVVTFDGKECPAECLGFPDLIGLGRLRTARFLSQLELCCGAKGQLATAFHAAASAYVSAYQEVQSAMRTDCTEKDLRRFSKALKQSISYFGFSQMEISRAKSSSGEAAAWAERQAEFGAVIIQSSGNNRYVELQADAVGSSYICRFMLSRDSDFNTEDSLFRRLATTLLDKIVLDLAVVAHEQGFEKEFCK